MTTNGPVITKVFENTRYGAEQQKSTLENAIRIYSKMPNDANNFGSNVGIVVGKVQSGKTANIITLSALALDNGYRIVILFLSDTNNLLTQNTERFKDAYDKVNKVKVCKKSTDGDFTTLIDPTALSYMHSTGKNLIICSLKHHGHIAQLTEYLKNSAFKDERVLIIDDEGDDIGLNTSGDRYATNSNGAVAEVNRTSTNQSIIGLKESFKKVAYISLTATPEANILLQNFQELAPDYCITMEPNSGYTGLIRFHSEDSDKVVVVDDHMDLKEENGIPESFAKALTFFIAGCIVRKQREGDEVKHSMMVHPCRENDTQEIVYDKIKAYLEKIQHDLKNQNTSGKRWCEIIKKEVALIGNGYTTDDQEIIVTVGMSIKLHLVNSKQSCNDLKSAMDILPYHIVVGGDMLDRGITIDGLAVTYMFRMAKTGQVDTLLQRARWFGYKESYFDLCRVYMPEDLKNQFLAMIEIEESIWDFLETCDKNNIAPRETTPYIQIPPEVKMRITAANKASYIADSLISNTKAQKNIVVNPAYNTSNLQLVGRLNWAKSNDIIFNARQKHRVLRITAADFKDFLKKYHFSTQETGLTKEHIEKLLDNHNFQDIDIWDMRYETHEQRSTKGCIVSGLMQGYSEGKAISDPDYYVGDRHLRTSTLSVQIHHVILKNDIEEPSNNGNIIYKTGDEVIMLAIVLPNGYIGTTSIRKMTEDEIITALSKAGRAKANIIVPSDPKQAIDSVYKCGNQWFLNIHCPYTGEIDSEYDGKITDRIGFDDCKLYGINDSIIGAIQIVTNGSKKAVFRVYKCYGMQGAAYVCEEKDPFIFDEIEIYSDWYKWNDYGYAACRAGDKWTLFKITQHPEPGCETVAKNKPSVADAFKSIGITDFIGRKAQL